MKPLQAFALLTLSAVAATAQTNTFPANGNVGIGTTNPQAKLQITGVYTLNQYTGIRVVPAPTVNDYQQLDFTHALGGRLSANITGNYPNDDILLTTTGFRFRTGDASIDPTEKLTILTGGNIGVGTTNPQAKLQITGVYTLNQYTGIRVVPAPTVNDYQQLDFTHALGGRLSANITGNYPNDDILLTTTGFRFRTGDASIDPTEKLTILTGGNVGIGTTNPTEKLSVNGKIRAKEVIVDTGWSDYVFEDGYTLQPLSVVEQQIKAHKHLPGVPSAADVAANGVSVGDMQSILLAKIEELTLHQIAQEKEIARLRESETSLRTEVQALRQAK